MTTEPAPEESRVAPVVGEIPVGRTVSAYPALYALRPDLGPAPDFVELVDEGLRPGGYRLVGLFEPGSDDASSVAGFRLATSLAWGRHIYVDDLSTLPNARGNGYAMALLRWVHAQARTDGCVAVHLDSGVGPSRAAAHRLYLNAGMTITCHHFTAPVGEPA